MSHDYLFELLTEEIPSWMLPTALDQLSGEIQSINRFFEGAASHQVGATSRRIYLTLTALPEKEADRDEEIKGPPRKACYTAEGNPTPALTGFLKKNNATLEAIISAPEDDYIRLRRLTAGRPLPEILGQEIPRIVQALRWPKMMRWGSGEWSFIRPVHGVLSLLDGKPLPIHVFGIPSTTRTSGHRTLSRKSFEVRSFDDYRDRLRAERVIIDAAEREEMLRARASDLAAAVGGVPAADETIWAQWRYLTEYPGLVRAKFREEYLFLPKEVLTTVMRVHQKQLPLLADGGLSNSFLAIADHDGDPDGNAAAGNAFVTDARFADAEFFYETDLRRPLLSRLPDLAHLQFQEKLGNYQTKTERIVHLAREIASEIGANVSAMEQAARLAKCDLVTEMVKEFTDLQGKIGGIYANHEGSPEEVWMAVYDHYQPLNVGDSLPRTQSGAILSLADRIDTLCGFFLIGLKPTGSRDPFALRRAAQGVIQILLNRDGWQIALPLSRLIGWGLDGYEEAGNRQQVEESLTEFFSERVRTLLETKFAYDEVLAAMEAGWSESIPDLADRARALASIRRSPAFLSLLDSAKRIENITAQSPAGTIDPSLLQHPTEKRLAEFIEFVSSKIDELAAERRYGEALELFAGIAGDLESFFREVMVMVEDQPLRENRIALLRKVGNAARRIADVTRIVVDRSDYDHRAER